MLGTSSHMDIENKLDKSMLDCKINFHYAFSIKQIEFRNEQTKNIPANMMSEDIVFIVPTNKCNFRSIQG